MCERVKSLTDLCAEGLRDAAPLVAHPGLVRVNRNRMALGELPQVLQLHPGRQLRAAGGEQRVLCIMR